MNHHFIKATMIILLSLIILILMIFPASSEEIYRFERMWPTLQQPWYFQNPAGICIDPQGNIFVVNAYTSTIYKLTKDGQLVTKWGYSGTGDGQFIDPNGIAVDGNGYVYVADTGYNRIQKFTSDGQFVMKWGRWGTGDGQFDSPNAIAVDGSDYVYVADTANYRIQKFTSDGQFVAKWGSLGTGNGEFHWPKGITVDKNDYVYVTDQTNYRIQKFTSTGEYVTKWGSQGTGNSQFSGPSGIAVDRNGSIYVSDAGSHVQKFSSDGQFVMKWGSFGMGDGQFYEPHGIAVDESGQIYVTDYLNYCIQKFDPYGHFVTKWGSLGTGNGQFNWPRGIAVDGSSNVYVVDAHNDRIQKFTPEGQFIMLWGGEGTGNGQFVIAEGIAVDGSGDVYVVDKYNDRIQKFTSNGVFVTKWGTSGTDDGQFDWPYGITVDRWGYVYVADTGNNRIQKFTTNGVFVTKWGTYGTGNSQFNEPFGVAADANGDYVYVTDAENNRVQKFTSTGGFVTKWGSWGAGDSQFKTPQGITVDGYGNVYVVDKYNNRVQKFTRNGVYVTQWGLRGFSPGQLNSPLCISMSSNNLIYITDFQNNRIQVFRKVETSSQNKAIIVAGGGAYPGNDLWDATQMSANFAYRTLTYQGFTKENIYYLTSDTQLDLDNNGVADDVAGDATNANLQNAITTWASGAEDVIMYLVDHGGEGSFRMSGNETLSAAQLSSWLNTLQNNITGKVIIIYDACESGSFVNALKPPSGKQRIVISSTSPGESAYFVTQGSVSFSSYFWTHIFNGVNIKDAFSLTKDAITYTTSYQHPLLDANGNGTANEAADLTLVQNSYIGNGTVIQGSAPVIGAVSPDQTINNTSSALLYASGVTDTDGIARVWAVIRPPDYNQGGSDSPIQSLPSIDLMPVGNDRYEATYSAFTTPGTYQIAVYARDRIGNTSIPKVTTVSVNNPLRRKAVIVAGGSQSDPLWPAVEKNAGLAYDALRFQGYVDDDIYFMSPVTFSSGIDGTPTLGNLQYALTTWGVTNTQDLVLYLIGNGGNGTFQISASETLNATDLKQWLDTLQNTISGKVTVIYDAPQSGSFLPVLAPPSGKQRIVISSAGSAQPANFLSSGDISFSKYFWSRVLNGMNVRDAYLHGKRAMSFLSGNQVAFLDDNGNGIGNEKADGQQALNYAIGFGITLGADDPMIGSVSPSQTLTGTPSATIWAKDVTTTGTIAKVWAVITPPGSSQNQNIPITDFPSIDLLYNATSNRYEGTYYRFNTQGDYSIVIYARDDEGNISLPSSTTVTQTTTLDPYEDDNSPAHASVIVLNDTAPQTHTFHAQGDEDWVKFYALKDVTYVIEASNLGPNADVVLRLYDSDGTTRILGPADEGCPPENQQCLGDEGGPGMAEEIPWTAQKTGIYYVRVKNYAPTVYGTGTNYDLKVYRSTLPAGFGTIKGIIISDRDLARIVGATIQAGLGSALSQDGSFILWVEAGSVNVSVNAEGFNSTTVKNVKVQAGQETSVTIRMVLPGDIDGSGKVNLADAILALQVISRMNPAGTVYKEADVNGDSKIGLPEVIYILQKAAGMR